MLLRHAIRALQDRVSEHLARPYSQELWELRKGSATMSFRPQRNLQAWRVQDDGHIWEKQRDWGGFWTNCGSDCHLPSTFSVPDTVLCLPHTLSQLLLLTLHLSLSPFYRLKHWSSEICLRLITQIVSCEAETQNQVYLSPKPLFLTSLPFGHQSFETQAMQTSQKERTE